VRNFGAIATARLAMDGVEEVFLGLQLLLLRLFPEESLDLFVLARSEVLELDEEGEGQEEGKDYLDCIEYLHC